VWALVGWARDGLRQNVRKSGVRKSGVRKPHPHAQYGYEVGANDNCKKVARCAERTK
jgi:hypothetical protein